MPPRNATQDRHCALFFPDDKSVVGGRKLGLTDNIDTVFLYKKQTANSRPYLSISLRFDRQDINYASFGDELKALQISIVFLKDTYEISGCYLSDDVHQSLFNTAPKEKKMYVAHIRLKDGHDALIRGIGMPFVGVNDTIQGYVTKQTKIDNSRTLREVMDQKEFHVLFANDGIKKAVENNFSVFMETDEGKVYPYGNEHFWDIARYGEQLGGPHADANAYPKTDYHQTANDALTSLTQSVVQDNYHLITDVAAISENPVRARFVHITKPVGDLEPTKLPDECYVIIAATELDCYQNTLRRVGKPKGAEGIIQHPDALGPDVRGDLIIRIRRIRQKTKLDSAPIEDSQHSDEPNASQQPDANSQEPDATSQEPDTNSQQPDANSEEPDANSEEPDANSEEPDANSEEPNAKSQEPDATSQEPEANSQEPDTNSQQPDTSSQKPDANSQQPDTSSQEPDADFQKPDVSQQPEGTFQEPPAFETFAAGGDHWDKVYLYMDDGATVVRRRVAVANQLFSFNPVPEEERVKKPKFKSRRKQPEFDDDEHQDLGDGDEPDDDDITTKEVQKALAIAPKTPDLAGQHEQRCMNAYLRDIYQGLGLPTALNPPPSLVEKPSDELTSRMDALNLGNQESILAPRYEFIEWSTPARVAAILDQLSQTDKERLTQYLSLCVLGLVAIAGFAGSGKTHQLAVVALLFNADPKVSQIYVSAPTHVAVKNIATRIHAIGKSINDHAARVNQWHIPFVVHGHSLEREVVNFIVLATDTTLTVPPIDEWQGPSIYALPLSPCEWLLKVVGSGSWKLDKDDHPTLLSLQQSFGQNAKYEKLREFANGTRKWDDVDDGKVLVKSLLVAIISGAEYVCTTPHTSRETPYKQVRAIAQAIVLDEAGAMHKLDALMVWGPLARPCAMAGDEKQLNPVVMEHEKNLFQEHGRDSILEHIKDIGYPRIVLNEQKRIAAGQFDLAHKLVYSHVKDFAYAQSAQLANQPIARELKVWSDQRYNLQSPSDKAYPVFLSVKKSPCVITTAHSRFNRGQNRAARKLIRDLLAQNKAISPGMISVVTPYRANLELLNYQMSKEPFGEKISITTTDSYQGRENDVVVLVLTVDQSSGPAFVANTARICVGTTRQKSALFVIGDVETVNQDLTKEQEKDVKALKGEEADDGEVIPVRHDMFRRFVQWFKDQSRVVDVPAADDGYDSSDDKDIPLAQNVGQQITDSTSGGCWGPDTNNDAFGDWGASSMPDGDAYGDASGDASGDWSAGLMPGGDAGAYSW